MADGYYQYEQDGVKHFTDKQPAADLKAIYKPGPERQGPQETDPVNMGIERAGVDPYNYNVENRAMEEFAQKKDGLFQHVFGRTGAENNLTEEQLKYWNQQVGQFKQGLLKKHQGVKSNAEKVVADTVKRFEEGQKLDLEKQKVDISRQKAQQKTGTKTGTGSGGYKESDYAGARDDLRNFYKTPTGMAGQLGFIGKGSKDRARAAEKIFNKWAKVKNPDGTPMYSPGDLISMADSKVREVEQQYWDMIDKHKDEIRKNPKAKEQLDHAFKKGIVIVDDKIVRVDKDGWGYVPQRDDF